MMFFYMVFEKQQAQFKHQPLKIIIFYFLCILDKQECLLGPRFLSQGDL